jgi:hypothetical protein
MRVSIEMGCVEIVALFFFPAPLAGEGSERALKTWMAGTSPAMTTFVSA